MKTILLFSVLIIHSFALDKIYFLPNDNIEVKKDIEILLTNATKSIDIAMYNFSYKRFAKVLKKASKHGVKVTIIYDKSNLKFYKKFTTIKSNRKQHIKLAIIDDKYAIFGSANWKKESFNSNYELINITDNTKRVQKLVNIFNQLVLEN